MPVRGLPVRVLVGGTLAEGRAGLVRGAASTAGCIRWGGRVRGAAGCGEHAVGVLRGRARGRRGPVVPSGVVRSVVGVSPGGGRPVPGRVGG